MADFNRARNSVKNFLGFTPMGILRLGLRRDFIKLLSWVELFIMRQ